MSLVTYGLGQGSGGGTPPVGPPALPSYSWTVAIPPDFTITPSVTYIDVIFPIAMGDLEQEAAYPQNWLFSGPVSLICTGISRPDINTVRLFIPEVKGGQLFTLTFPPEGIKNSFGEEYSGVRNGTFTSAGVTPFVSSVSVINTERLLVTYSKPMNEWDCRDSSNYSISPDLRILKIEKRSDNTFLLHTDPQTPAVSYSLTVTGVRDYLGNVI
jgi:hypothetical protein